MFSYLDSKSSPKGSSSSLRWCLFPDFTPTSSQRSSVKFDFAICFLLFFWGACFYFLGLHIPEYFRHTEADRTLIGWEMFKSREYIVPHLLEAIILTKPPLFYWLVAFSIELMGTAAEWAARVPSAIAALILLISHYLFLRKVSCSYVTALFGAIMAGSGGALFLLSGVAEIDMVFCLFCSLALYGLYFTTQKPDRGIIYTYILASLAFLTKGPQIILFFGAAFVVYETWRLLLSCPEEKARARKDFLSLIINHIWGVLVFIAIVGLWVLALGYRVGFELLYQELQYEVVNRVVIPSTRARGPFFYFGALGSGLAPWTILAVGLFAPFFPKFSVSYKQLKSNSAYFSFFIFNLSVVVTAFVMLSIASGKSNRYIFPVYPFAMNLALFGWMHLRETKVNAWLKWFCVGVLLLLVGGGIALPFISMFEVVSLNSRIVASITIVITALLMIWVLIKCPFAKIAIPVLLLFLLSVRYGYTYVFSNYRNAKRSVKQLALSFNQAMPKEEKLYTLEMFERWVIYYMMQDGRRVQRLTPEKALNLSKEEGSLYILIQKNQELWRLKQLAKSGMNPEIVLEVLDTRDPLVLIKANKKSLSELSLSRRAPTEASPIPAEFLATSPPRLLQP